MTALAPIRWTHRSPPATAQPSAAGAELIVEVHEIKPATGTRLQPLTVRIDAFHPPAEASGHADEAVVLDAPDADALDVLESELLESLETESLESEPSAPLEPASLGLVESEPPESLELESLESLESPESLESESLESLGVATVESLSSESDDPFISFRTPSRLGSAR